MEVRLGSARRAIAISYIDLQSLAPHELQHKHVSLVKVERAHDTL